MGAKFFLLLIRIYLYLFSGVHTLHLQGGGSYLYLFVDHFGNNYSQIDGTTRHAKVPYEFWR